jgi:hypothetical protein
MPVNRTGICQHHPAAVHGILDFLRSPIGNGNLAWMRRRGYARWITLW